MAEDPREEYANLEPATTEPSSKRQKLDPPPHDPKKGTAPIKPEYLVHTSTTKPEADKHIIDDDAAEAAPKGGSGENGKREKKRGQNKARQFGSFREKRRLCRTRVHRPEFSPVECSFGDRCRDEHDVRKYLSEFKREDLTTFGGKCPTWEATGSCQSGWRCRFVGSHMEERTTEDGRKELFLTSKQSADSDDQDEQAAQGVGVVNAVEAKTKIAMSKRQVKTPKADRYLDWLQEKQDRNSPPREDANGNDKAEATEQTDSKKELEDSRANFVDTPLLPSEKRRIYFGPETPALAPLTTQGNLPFRRLCVELGAQVTYSEMAMSVPLMQGHKSEWALLKAHESEASPPQITSNSPFTSPSYDHSKDLRFGAQISGNKPWNVLRATELLTTVCPHMRVVDLNCGCPIDLVYKQGAGSALLDTPAKLEKMLTGMNTVSGEVPITCKIRMGTKDGKPTAQKLIDRLAYGSTETQRPCGVAAITLHGRSRQQRYSRSADWEYIAECAAIVKRFREEEASRTDTIRESDARYGPANGHLYFLGNGDCYSHFDYQQHIDTAQVDAVMVARGAIIKPWIFEEIATGQYLDKSATERLGLVKKYVRYGLDAWGSDELGVGHTRRFLLEWLSFAHRYVPIGILEYLPPNIQDRAPAWQGRSELETLLGSDNYKDWIKIRWVNVHTR